MAKRIIYISISLITGALLCVISFQVAWYNNAHALKTQLFERSVQDALKDVVKQIENREAADVITDRVEFFVTPAQPEHLPAIKPIAPVEVPPAPPAAPAFPSALPALPALHISAIPPMPPMPPVTPLTWPARTSASTTQSRIIVKRFESVYTDSSNNRPSQNDAPTVTAVSGRVTDHERVLYSVSGIDSSYVLKVNKSDTSPISPVVLGELITSNIHSGRTENEKIFENTYDGGFFKWPAASGKGDEAKLPKAQTEPGKLVKEKLCEVLNRLVKEVEYKEQSQETRLPTDTLKRYITQALNNQGIREQFVFAVKTDTMLKTQLDTAKGKPFTVVLYPNDLAHHTALLQVIIPGQGKRIFKSMAMHLAGSFVFTLILIFAFAYTIYVMMKQKKIAEIRNDFINNMTHELKTPIATISLAADTIRSSQTLSDAEKVKYYTGVIKEENRRMNEQVEKVLQLALTDKSTFDLNAVPCHLHELVMNALNKFGMIVESEQRRINIHLEAETDLVVADCFHLGNAIANIIDNAIKYSAPETPITIRTINTGPAIALSISDEGIGMKKEVQKKVFDKFYRAQQGNVHDVKGFGIGLSYAKNVVSAHKGTIVLQSAHGKGTTFVITLNIKQ